MSSGDRPRGRRAFAGKSSMDTIGAILRDEAVEIPTVPVALGGLCATLVSECV
jgi:hypothetical protein